MIHSVHRAPFGLGLSLYKWGVIYKWRGIYNALGPKVNHQRLLNRMTPR